MWKLVYENGDPVPDGAILTDRGGTDYRMRGFTLLSPRFESEVCVSVRGSNTWLPLSMFGLRFVSDVKTWTVVVTIQNQQEVRRRTVKGKNIIEALAAYHDDVEDHFNEDLSSEGIEIWEVKG